MLDQTCKLSKLLEASLQGGLAELAKRQFILVVADLFKHSIEMVLAIITLALTIRPKADTGRVLEDKFHESLGWQIKFAFDGSLGVFLIVAGFLVYIVIFVRLLDVGILLVLRLVHPIGPFQPSLLLKFLLEILLGVLQRGLFHGLDLTFFAYSPPSGMGIESALLLLICKDLERIKLYGG